MPPTQMHLKVCEGRVASASVPALAETWRLRPRPSRDPERAAGLALNSGESGYLLLKWVWHC